MKKKKKNINRIKHLIDLWLGYYHWFFIMYIAC